MQNGHILSDLHRADWAHMPISVSWHQSACLYLRPPILCIIYRKQKARLTLILLPFDLIFSSNSNVVRKQFLHKPASFNKQNTKCELGLNKLYNVLFPFFVTIETISKMRIEVHNIESTAPYDQLRWETAANYGEKYLAVNESHVLEP